MEALALPNATGEGSRRRFLVRPADYWVAERRAAELGAALLGARFLWAYMAGDGAGKVQSLILLSVLAMAAFISFAVGVIAELQAANRNLLEDIRLRLLRRELADEELRSQRARFDQVRQELADADPAQRLASLQSRAG